MSLSETAFAERAAERVAARDYRALQTQVAGLRNLSESMRRDGKWKASAMFVAEAAWTIEKLAAALQSEGTGA